MPSSEIADARQEAGQFLIVDLTVLKSANIKGALSVRKNPLPVVERFVERHNLPATELLGALRKRGDENRNVFDRLAVPPDVVEKFDDVCVVSRRFMAKIPSLEGWVMPVTHDGLVDKRLIEVDFLPPTAPIPKITGVVGAKVNFQSQFVREAKEHLADVFVDWEQIRNGFGWENALVLVPGANDDHRVDSDRSVEFKFSSPLIPSPILGWNVVGDFV